MNMIYVLNNNMFSLGFIYHMVIISSCAVNETIICKMFQIRVAAIVDIIYTMFDLYRRLSVFSQYEKTVIHWKWLE